MIKEIKKKLIEVSINQKNQIFKRPNYKKIKFIIYYIYDNYDKTK